MVRTIGWDQVIQSFKKIWDSGDTRTINTRTFNSSWNQEILQLSIALDEFRRSALSVPIGKTRDSIICLLELEPVTGLDVDLLHEFADLKGTSLASIRDDSHQIAKELLNKQIKRGDTFYLDVQSMLASPYYDVVESVIEKRSSEVLALGERHNIEEVVSTYYGFMIAIQGVIETEHAGLSKEVKSAIEKLAESFGKSLKIEGIRLEYDPSLFPNCSAEKAALLVDVLSIGIGSKSTTSKAVSRLMRTCDSRPVDLLIRKLNAPSAKQHRSQLITLLSRIGHHRAFEAMREISELKHEIATDAIAAIGNIRSPDSLPYLVELSNDVFQNGKKWSSGRINRGQTVLISLGRTQEPEAIPILENALFHDREEIVLAALTGLIVNDDRDNQTLFKHLDRIIEIIREHESPASAIGILLAIPSILELEEITKSVVERIDSEPEKAITVLRAFNAYPDIEIPSDIIDASVDTLDKVDSSSRFLILKEFYNHPLYKQVLESPELGKKMQSHLAESDVKYRNIYDLMVFITIPQLRKNKHVLNQIADQMKARSAPGEMLLELMFEKYPEIIKNSSVAKVIAEYWADWVKYLREKKKSES